MSWQDDFSQELSEKKGPVVSKGMVRHYERLTKESHFHTCEVCELSIGKYPGRNRRYCPNCGEDMAAQKSYPSKQLKSPAPEDTISEFSDGSEALPLGDRMQAWATMDTVCESVHASLGFPLIPWTRNHRTITCEAIENGKVIFSVTAPCWESRNRIVGRIDVELAEFKEESLKENVREVIADYYESAESSTPLPRTLAEALGSDNFDPVSPDSQRGATFEKGMPKGAYWTSTKGKKGRPKGKTPWGPDTKHSGKDIRGHRTGPVVGPGQTGDQSASASHGIPVGVGQGQLGEISTPAALVPGDARGDEPSAGPSGNKVELHPATNGPAASGVDGDDDIDELIDGLPYGGGTVKPKWAEAFKADLSEAFFTREGLLKTARENPIIDMTQPGSKARVGDRVWCGPEKQLGIAVETDSNILICRDQLGKEYTYEDGVAEALDVGSLTQRLKGMFGREFFAPDGHKYELVGASPRSKAKPFKVKRLTDGKILGIRAETLADYFKIKEDLQEQGDGVDRGEHPEEGTKKYTAAVAIIVKDGREILLGKSSEKVDDDRKGYWTFPGGGIDPEDGNDPVAAAIREAQEEMGVQCISTSTILTHPDKPSVAFVVCTYLRGEPTLNEEFSAFVWMPYVTRHDFPGLYPVNRAVLEQVPPGLLRENELSDLVYEAFAFVEKTLSPNKPAKAVGNRSVSGGSAAEPPEGTKPGTSMKSPEKQEPVDPEITKPQKPTTLTPVGDGEELQTAVRDDQEDKEDEEAQAAPGGKAPPGGGKAPPFGGKGKEKAPDQAAVDGEEVPSDEPEKKADAAMAKNAAAAKKPAAPPPQPQQPAQAPMEPQPVAQAQAAQGEPDPNELAIGIEIEQATTPDPAQAEQVARANLAQDPQYYTKMQQQTGQAPPAQGAPPQQQPSAPGTPPDQAAAQPPEKGAVPPQKAQEPGQQVPAKAPGQFPPGQEDPQADANGDNGDAPPADPNGQPDPNAPPIGQQPRGVPGQPQQPAQAAAPGQPPVPGQQPGVPGQQPPGAAGQPGAPEGAPGQAPIVTAPTQTVDLVFGEPETTQNAYDWFQALKLANVTMDGTTVRVMVTGPAEMLMAQRVAQAFGLELSGLTP